MSKILFTVLILIFTQSSPKLQEVSEKELFTLGYEGKPDIYFFKYDESTGKHAYLYYIENEKKYFLILDSGMSEKYDVISAQDLKFDSKGNTFVTADNYLGDYGSNNYFLLVNGKSVFNSDFIESHSSFINKDGEFVFIFKDSDNFRIGKYSLDKGLTQSENYEVLRSVYKDSVNYLQESDEGANIKDYFYRDENGERCFIGIKNNKVKIIFETHEIQTDYSDIHDASFTKNRNNELSYIAKKGGKFYENNGNEFVVSGSKVYNSFQSAHPPILFSKNNEPVYYCSDSISPDKYKYYVVSGNKIQKYTDINKNKKSEPVFGNGISDLQISPDGSISYIGYSELVIKKSKNNTEGNDEYFTKSYYVKNGEARELGYNLGTVKFKSDGSLLYTAIADIKKKDNLLIESNGDSRIIQNKEIFDYIYDYGYTPDGKIYYFGQNNSSDDSKTEFETKFFIGNEMKGKYDNFVFQYSDDNYSILKFDTKKNYAFVTERFKDYSDRNQSVYVNNKLLPFPGTLISGVKNFTGISGLCYTKNDKLLFFGEYENDNSESFKEIYIDNISAGRQYSSIGNYSNNEEGNQITFLATRDKSIYLVKINF